VTNPAETFVWRPGPPPPDMPVSQVYGWLLDEHGRVLLQDTPEGFNLPGGSPEPQDADASATLVREADEESQVAISDAVLLGFEELHRAGRAPVALVRMVGRIGAFGPRRLDPDGGRLLGRRMTSLTSAAALLDWGESGVAQAMAAGEAAGTLWRLPVRCPSVPDGYVH